MNKNRHRIIFSAARGQRMVVAETAGTSTGGASGNTTAVSRKTLSLSGWVLTFGLALHCTAPAQIVVDPSAPGSQRPTVLSSGNGVPVVNIQTPSAAGVSRNTYSQFDVQSNGAILNNSRTNTGTQLGGHIAGNVWLATGEARVILNEVRSSNPTHLNGYVEVAGRRAEVIIANPAGIQVNGGGFINAAGVTLTTGVPVMNNGHLESFRVGGGKVRIEGLGLDTSSADTTTILARAVEVNASLWARNLTVVTGTNEVKALASGAAAQATPITGSATEPTPSFMLDVAAIGGMYAGRIYLVGTEAGLGVNNRGSLIAQEGKWVLKADGSLINTGKLQAKGDLSIRTGGAIGNTGPDALISSQGNAHITAGADISNTHQAQIAASGTLGVNAVGALDNTAGTLAADGAVQIATAGIDNTQGTLASTQATLNLDTDTQAITNSHGRIEAGQSLTANSGTLNNEDGLIQSLGTLNIDASGDLDNRQGTVVAGGAMDISAQDIHNTEGSVTFLHDNKNNGNGTSTASTAAASTVGSLGGDVVITAGGKYQQTGSDVLALAGDRERHLSIQQNSRRLFNAAALRHDNVEHLVLDEVYCTASKCRMGTPSTAYYSDTNHISTDGARLAQARFQAALQSAIGLRLTPPAPASPK